MNPHEARPGRVAPADGSCPACGEPLVAGARFCESCGTPTGLPPDDVAGAGRPDGLPACDRCGGEVGPDGYCTVCGHRAEDPVEVHAVGPVGWATHRGHRHHRNEDAGGVVRTAEGWPVLVVADGVSASPSPDEASAAAVEAVVAALRDRPVTGEGDLAAALEAAHAAVSALPHDRDPHWPPDDTHPACTIAVAVAGPTVRVANVGDARAYLLAPAGDGWRATQLSSDDSVAAAAVAQGIDLEVALALPGGHGITAWLGADAFDLDPHLTSVDAPAGALVLVCSDGLWNYAPTDEAMSALVSAALGPPGRPAGPLPAVCELLVRWALDQGGADNVTVALAPVGDTSELEENP